MLIFETFDYLVENFRSLDVFVIRCETRREMNAKYFPGFHYAYRGKHYVSAMDGSYFCKETLIRQPMSQKP